MSESQPKILSTNLQRRTLIKGAAAAGGAHIRKGHHASGGCGTLDQRTAGKTLRNSRIGHGDLLG